MRESHDVIEVVVRRFGVKGEPCGRFDGTGGVFVVIDDVGHFDDVVFVVGDEESFLPRGGRIEVGHHKGGDGNVFFVAARIGDDGERAVEIELFVHGVGRFERIGLYGNGRDFPFRTAYKRHAKEKRKE